MIIELLLFAISIAAIVSSNDFIAKAITNFAGYLGVPEYLISTIVLSFIANLPIFTAALISNIFNVPAIGMSMIIGFSMAVLTLVMGVFLLRNEISVEYERYRNATFMWAASLLFFIVVFDGYIDRIDGLFLISLFSFYALYLYYRTKTSKEYSFSKAKKSNVLLFIPALIALVLSVFAAVSTISILSSQYIISMALLPMTLLGTALILPLFDFIRIIPRDNILIFDNILGSIIVSLTLVPGLIAIISPMSFFVEPKFGLYPLLMLSGVSLTFSILTRLSEKLHKKTGIFLIASYIAFIGLLLM
jgi:cation:H+ antiporter